MEYGFDNSFIRRSSSREGSCFADPHLGVQGCEGLEIFVPPSSFDGGDRVDPYSTTNSTIIYLLLLDIWRVLVR